MIFQVKQKVFLKSTQEFGFIVGKSSDCDRDLKFKNTYIITLESGKRLNVSESEISFLGEIIPQENIFIPKEYRFYTINDLKLDLNRSRQKNKPYCEGEVGDFVRIPKCIEADNWRKNMHKLIPFQKRWTCDSTSFTTLRSLPL